MDRALKERIVGATVLVVIAVLVSITLPRVQPDPTEPKGLRRLLGGLVWLVGRKNARSEIRLCLNVKIWTTT